MTGAGRFGYDMPSFEGSAERFAARVRRLVAVSIIALGIITMIVVTRAGVGHEPSVLLAVAGWVSMPAILVVSLRRPVWRYLLIVPAAAVSVALLVVSIRFAGSGPATAGWWMMTCGVLTGSSLGAWFWYRWLPLPRSLADPFSPGRWILIGLHVGLIVAGGVLVLW